MEAFLAVRIVTPGSMAEIYGLTRLAIVQNGKKKVSRKFRQFPGR